MRIGLIPAWAGKTPALAAKSPKCAAHPRVGGENPDSSEVTASNGGSSPRGRGKPVDGAFGELGPRLIPAWAGKTILILVHYCNARAHPRVGGENVDFCPREIPPEGSSPRGRGKLISRVRSYADERLIPAWAGKTNHTNFVTRVTQGSSPRGRGKRAA